VVKENIVALFQTYPEAALVISLAASIMVAVLGLVPSVFITAANILFFGFWRGTFISFLGEALGAVVSFWLYRKGFRNMMGGALNRYPKARRLVTAKGKEAAMLIFSLRLLPFVPSGLVTFAAAVGTVPAWLFVTASSLGKLPALLLEAYAVYQVTAFGWQGKLLLTIAALGLLYWVWQRNKSSKKAPREDNT
jgi:uncharacterized membrane protein YdjX (TVP38/TMEM64 family)